MPTLRPFRALRYAPAIGPDLTAVVCPPDTSSRPPSGSPCGSVTSTTRCVWSWPDPEPGGEPATRYRSAARTLAEWRTAGHPGQGAPAVDLPPRDDLGRHPRSHPGSRPRRVRAAAPGGDLAPTVVSGRMGGP